jgi:uncharacterized protein YggE
MLTRFEACFAVLLLWGPSGSQAQDFQLVRTNKIFEATGTSIVEVEPETATLHLGVERCGVSQRAALDQLVGPSDRIRKALIESGVPGTSIEIRAVRIQRLYNPEKQTTKSSTTEFVVLREWVIRIPAANVEKYVQIAVHAGANAFPEVEWEVSDPKDLMKKAVGAALKNAQDLADQTAKDKGVKLGKFLYFRNEPSTFERISPTLMATSCGEELPPFVDSLLSHERVRASATVTAVFAIR